MNPTAPPRLSHLKFWAPCAPSITECEAIIAFVASKTRLRCFDYYDECFTDAEEVAPLLSTLCSLPALETLD